MRQVNVLSKRVFETARKLPDTIPEPFIALEEYDRTGKLTLNFTLDPALFKPFKEYCEKHGRRISPFLERAMTRRLRYADVKVAVSLLPQRIFK